MIEFGRVITINIRRKVIFYQIAS